MQLRELNAAQPARMRARRCDAAFVVMLLMLLPTAGASTRIAPVGKRTPSNSAKRTPHAARAATKQQRYLRLLLLGDGSTAGSAGSWDGSHRRGRGVIPTPFPAPLLWRITGEMHRAVRT